MLDYWRVSPSLQSSILFCSTFHDPSDAPEWWSWETYPMDASIPWYTTNIPKQNEIYTSFTCLCSVLNYCTYLYNPIESYIPMAHASQSFIIERKGMSWVQDMTKNCRVLAAPMGHPDCFQILWFHHDHRRATCERGMGPGWSLPS